MVTDKEIENILATQPLTVNAEKMVGALLGQMHCCPFCPEEIFVSKANLIQHVETIHTDKLISEGKQRVNDHKVEQGSEEILICSYCPFAVSNDSAYYYAASIMPNHVERDCPGKPRGAGISFRRSKDGNLIDKYIRGEVYVELFHCPAPGCNQTFGSREAVKQHLAARHSAVRKNEIQKELVDRIYSLANMISEQRKPQMPETLEKSNTDAGVADFVEEITAEEDKQTSPIFIPVTPLPEPIFTGVTSSKTLTHEEIRDGNLYLPPNLRGMFRAMNELKVQFPLDQEKNLRFKFFDNRLDGLEEWYSENAVEPGDIVNIEILGEVTLKIWTEWKKNISYIFQTSPEDMKWDNLSIRDCLLKVFYHLGRPVHYRVLYSEISKHRPLVISSVVATLSKYRDILFSHTGQGEWKTIKSPVPRNQRPKRIGIVSENVDDQLTERILEIAAEIKEQDLVYELLSRLSQDLSFDQICQKIAESYQIDWQALAKTGFFDAKDPRFRRLVEGNFALEKWFIESIQDTPVTVEVPKMEEQHPPEQWFLRMKGETSIYGPMSIDILVKAAEDFRVGPEHEVSQDQESWISAQNVMELGMNCMVRLVNDNLYGPINPKAQEYLRNENLLAPIIVDESNIAKPIDTLPIPEKMQEEYPEPSEIIISYEEESIPPQPETTITAEINSGIPALIESEEQYGSNTSGPIVALPILEKMPEAEPEPLSVAIIRGKESISPEPEITITAEKQSDASALFEPEQPQDVNLAQSIPVIVQTQESPKPLNISYEEVSSPPTPETTITAEINAGIPTLIESEEQYESNTSDPIVTLPILEKMPEAEPEPLSVAIIRGKESISPEPEITITAEKQSDASALFEPEQPQDVNLAQSIPVIVQTQESPKPLNISYEEVSSPPTPETTITAEINAGIPTLIESEEQYESNTSDPIVTLPILEKMPEAEPEPLSVAIIRGKESISPEPEITITAEKQSDASALLKPEQPQDVNLAQSIPVIVQTQESPDPLNHVVISKGFFSKVWSFIVRMLGFKRS